MSDPYRLSRLEVAARNRDARVQWAAVAVILLLVGGLIIAAAYTGGANKPVRYSGAPVQACVRSGFEIVCGELVR